MGQESDTVRAEIAGTRDDISQTLNAIGDKVSPKQMARRQTGRFRERAAGIRTAVMGRADDVAQGMQGAAGAAGGGAHGVAQAVQGAPQMAKTQAQGNPLAAGLIAFGVGLLAASVIPASERERQVAAKVGQSAQPAVGQAQEAVQEIRSEVQSSAQDAIGQMKDRASSATEQVKQQATSSAQDLAGSARDAAGEVRAQAQPGDPAR